ncbi:ATP-binding protein [Sphingomonas oleivorans]|uniref:ATP-binding protein n=1 Tax=Sphingomonas oleivorans TaxID=1735121 RepID=A0A2T5FV57_9SPHN|nr:ATP-binding protein [Sphingomonas oleivorans]PTQ08599.1 ATP-binding protein [Sphingomonas oleivorans]
MTVSIDMGLSDRGAPALMDLEELLATRLLVQGNSGSGKSHLLRRLIEGSAQWVQQVIIDPEGDFVTLSDRFGHSVVEGAGYSDGEILQIASRIREHRISVVLNLEGLDADAQMRCAAIFLNGLFDAPRDHWYPALVVVDEAQIFAPAVAGEVSDDARRASLGAMTNLMCRGRKRGLAGVIATQRLAKLAKNVAAEASNFLMGRTFLDIDMARAADLLGMDRRQAETIRDLERGHFLALGPALSRRPMPIRIGAVETSARTGSPKLIPLPSTPPADAQTLLFEPMAEPAPPPPPPPPPPSANELLRTFAKPVFGERAAEQPSRPMLSTEEREAVIANVLREIVEDADAAFRSPALLFQDFGVRCRMHGLSDSMVDLPAFRKRLSLARAGIFDPAADERFAPAIALAEELPEDMQGMFLMIARAALHGEACPSDDRIAAVYGTHSPGRVRRLLAYLEQNGMLAQRIDMRGDRRIAVPRLGWTTGPGGQKAGDAPRTAPLPFARDDAADGGTLL